MSEFDLLKDTAVKHMVVTGKINDNSTFEVVVTNKYGKNPRVAVDVKEDDGKWVRYLYGFLITQPHKRTRKKTKSIHDITE